MPNIIKVAIPLSKFETITDPVTTAFNAAMKDLCTQFPKILIPYAAQEHQRKTGSWFVKERPHFYEKEAGLCKSTLHIFDIGFLSSVDSCTVCEEIPIVAYAGCQKAADENLMLGLVSPQRILNSLKQIDALWEFPDTPCIVASSTQGKQQRVDFTLE
ncbi:MAG: hypothetical protein AB7S81_06815 [Bdellovibrionales bacterium]